MFYIKMFYFYFEDSLKYLFNSGIIITLIKRKLFIFYELWNYYDYFL